MSFKMVKNKWHISHINAYFLLESALLLNGLGGCICSFKNCSQFKLKMCPLTCTSTTTTTNLIAGHKPLSFLASSHYHTFTSTISLS